MKLSILIPTLFSRKEKFSNLMAILSSQANDEVEVVINRDNGEKSIGEKRNELLKEATGDYVCFVDDDDEVVNNFVELILKALESNPTHCSLKGVYTVDGKEPELFEHSIKYKEYKTNRDFLYIKYERYPNHLNTIKKEIAVKYSFLPINHSEDTEWAHQIMKGGELTTEAKIDEVLYHYKFITNK